MKDQVLNKKGWIITRRTFVGGATVVGLGGLVPPSGAAGPRKLVSFGVITDVHYANDAAPHNTKFYAGSLKKMAAFIETAQSEMVDFVVELGDYTNENKKPTRTRESALENLDAIEAVIKKFKGPVYHVFGNHDVVTLGKEEHNKHAPNPGIPIDKSYYSFDMGGVHFVALDGCYSKTGTDAPSTKCNLPKFELEWLKQNLESTDKPTIGLIHQPIYGSGKMASEAGHAVLKESGKVLAVLQGHRHRHLHEQVDGIHYCTLKDAVNGKTIEKSAFSIIEIYSDSSMVVKGYHQGMNEEFSSPVNETQVASELPVMRIWTDIKGRRLEAEYMSEAAGMVKLMPRNGTAVTLPREKLSTIDVNYLDQNHPVATGFGM